MINCALIFCVWQMLKQQSVTPPPPVMCVRRDTAAHRQPLPWQPPRRRHSNDQRLRSNDDHDNDDTPAPPPIITTNLDDMIDALDHDITTHICSADKSASSGDTQATNTDRLSDGSSPLSLQLSLLS